MGLTKGMTTADKRDSFFVIHCHAAECVANIVGRGLWVRVSVRPFGVHIDEAHLHGGQWIFEIAVARVTTVGSAAKFKPFRFLTPINISLRLVDIFAPARKSEGFKAHRFHCDIPRKDNQVCPRNRIAIFLLDRPK